MFKGAVGHLSHKATTRRRRRIEKRSQLNVEKLADLLCLCGCPSSSVFVPFVSTLRGPCFWEGVNPDQPSVDLTASLIEPEANPDVRPSAVSLCLCGYPSSSSVVVPFVSAKPSWSRLRVVRSRG